MMSIVSENAILKVMIILLDKKGFYVIIYTNIDNIIDKIIKGGLLL